MPHHVGMATFDVRVEDYDPGDLVAMAAGPEWALDPTRAALLVHDLQPYYLDVLAANVRTRLVPIEATADYTRDLHATALTLISALTGRVTTVSQIVDTGESEPIPHGAGRS